MTQKYLNLCKICYFCLCSGSRQVGTGSGVVSSFKKIYRGVAQLVAYYVRDVGAGSSSLLTPTLPAEVRIFLNEGGLLLLSA